MFWGSAAMLLLQIDNSHNHRMASWMMDACISNRLATLDACAVSGGWVSKQLLLTSVFVHIGSVVAAALLLPVLSVYMEFACDNYQWIWLHDFPLPLLKERESSRGEREEEKESVDRKKYFPSPVVCVLSSLWHSTHSHTYIICTEYLISLNHKNIQ